MTTSDRRPASPEICANVTVEGFDPAECIARALPVTPCESPAHPELVGLWGLRSDDRTLTGRLLYDGCTATVPIFPSASLDIYDERARLEGRVPPHAGIAHRGRAEWEERTLYAVTVFGRRPVARLAPGSPPRLLDAQLRGDRESRPLLR